MAKKAVIAITSYQGTFYPDGKKTGLFLTEALHPLNVFVSKGYEVVFVSETGKYGFDENSLAPDFLNGKDLEDYKDPDSRFNQLLRNIKTPQQLNSKEYSILFAAGGHGTCFDFPKAQGLHGLISDIYNNGGVIAAVCHGPMVFQGLINKATGKSLIEGKNVTGFTEKGESLMGVDQVLETEKILTVPAVCKLGKGNYIDPSGVWDDFTVVDGKIVTGVNPASATSTALKAVEAAQ